MALAETVPGFLTASGNNSVKTATFTLQRQAIDEDATGGHVDDSQQPDSLCFEAVRAARPDERNRLRYLQRIFHKINALTAGFEV
ncbi:hypothetical protein [Cupriavidus lacunae]|uniref:hypothetical protein n=1 Tax=Cupriavidus lacunae TaxID=2666307 RepID=UPI0013752278|nr:hypothetical protein [Cupriavidus lacunae]